jgi:hypothetical protein
MRAKPSVIVMNLMLTALLSLSTAAGLAKVPAHQTGTVKPSAAAAPAKKFALLVGINDYISPTLRKLYGCENDVLDMRKVLTELYGFADDDQHIKTLLSMKPRQEATRKNILDALDNFLVKNAEQNHGGTIVFYFSGHGSRIKDQNGDETADSVDETIVPVDSRTEEVYDILDDEIGKRIDTIRKVTSNITFIFDSCHSGTISRGPLAKEAPEDTRPSPPSGPGVSSSTSKMQAARRPAATSSSGAAQGKTSDDELIHGYDAPRNKSYVLISGSLSIQQSYEMPRELTERPNGTMTYNLVRALRDNPSGTYREIMQTVADSVYKVYTFQTPQVEGDVDRPFFGTPGERRKTPINILESSGNTIKLNAGRALGVRDGTYIAVYSATAKDLAGDNNRLAHGRVKGEPDNFSSTATVTMVDPNLKSIPLNANAVLISPSFGGGPRRVAFDTSMGTPAPDRSDASAAVLKELTEQLKESELVSITPTTQPLKVINKDAWDVAVVRGTYAAFKEGMKMPPAGKDDAEPDPKADGYYITKNDGWPLYYFWVSVDDREAAAKIALALERHARQDNLRSLTNEVSTLKNKVMLNVYRVTGKNIVDGQPQPILESKPANELGMPQFKLEQQFVIEIKNTSTQDLFVYLYALGTSGSINLMELPLSRDEMLLRGKSIQTVPYRTGLPMGLESFKVICSTKKIETPEVFEQFGITREVKGDESPLDQLLRQAATGQRDVGQDPKFKVNDWATARLDFFTFNKSEK